MSVYHEVGIKGKYCISQIADDIRHGGNWRGEARFQPGPKAEVGEVVIYVIADTEREAASKLFKAVRSIETDAEAMSRRLETVYKAP